MHYQSNLGSMHIYRLLMHDDCRASTMHDDKIVQAQSYKTMLQNELIIGSNLQSFIEWLGRYFALLLIKNYKVSMTRTSTIKLYGPE